MRIIRTAHLQQKPVVLYHGTSEPLAVILNGLVPNRGLVFLTDNPELAVQYAQTDGERTRNAVGYIVGIRASSLDQQKLIPDPDHEQWDGENEIETWEQGLAANDQCAYLANIPRSAFVFVDEINLNTGTHRRVYPAPKMAQTEEDYRGQHQAPDKSDGAPLHDVTLNGIYPADFYGPEGLRYYAHDQISMQAMSLVQRMRNHPRWGVTIYRAIPKVLTDQDRIIELQKQKAYILRTGKIPRNVNTSLNKSQYFDKIWEELQRLEATAQPTVQQSRITINPGDWVTIVRGYAVEHGQGNINGQYRIIQKTVPARCLYTDGNSISEWGYDP